MKNRLMNTPNLVILAVLLVAGIVIVSDLQRGTQTSTPNFASQAEIKKFDSQEQLKQFLESSQQTSLGYGSGAMMRGNAMQTATADSGVAPMAGGEKASGSYSTTNNQIEGVDEADFVKNDGKYIYMITDSGRSIAIVDASPAADMKIVSLINLTGEEPNNIFVNGDKLVIFGNINSGYYGGPVPLTAGGGFAGAESAPSVEAVESDAMPPTPPGMNEPSESLPPVMTDTKEVMPIEGKMMTRPGYYPQYYNPQTYVKIYDISDRASPLLENEINFNGTYYDSRMIGGHAYVILNSPANLNFIPTFAPNEGRFPGIYYFDVPDYSYQFTNVVSVDINTAQVKNKVFLLGYSSNIFVSEKNIYLVYQKRVSETFIYQRILDEVILPVVPEDVAKKIKDIQNSDLSEAGKFQEISEEVRYWLEDLNPEQSQDLYQRMQDKYTQLQQDLAKDMEKSVIHKISIDNGDIEYRAKGEVSGYPLNQFSMDENNGYFRIATTTGQWTGSSANHMYVLDENMNTVGKLEDLAPGERIYSVRYMGGRAYMVTFKQVDPLFVIDLSDPTNPSVLGKLKIPGWSDYLHPYDENHVIGIGKDVDAEIDKDKVHQTDAIYYTAVKGVKISLFDVSDVSDPKEISKFVIGDRGTETPAAYDHKAFLFSKEKNLLVIPVTEYRTKAGQDWGQYAGQNAYVFNINLDGISLKGKITHSNLTIDENKPDYYYQDWNANVQRSLYINDMLYTISQKMIKANSLDNLDEISHISLPVFDYLAMPMMGIAVDKPAPL